MLGHWLLFWAVVLVQVLMGQTLRVFNLYVAFRMLQVLTMTFMGFGYMTIQTIGETISTVNRLCKFLKLDELQRDQISPEQEKVLPEDCLIEIDNITSKWDEEIEQPTLQKVSAVVSPGKLMAVIGPVGAGKSSLLMSVLKELPVSEGSVKVQGSIAYVSQQPWVFSASLRQNIVFGNKYEKAKYDRILKACALNKDVAVMPHGDLTLIGDRGVSLSGGQRARVSLARALYMNADVYLLDDPLSAVDTAVGRHIFNNVIQGLLKDKPRILVTHQLQFLKEAAEILILKDGEMIGKGTFQDLSVSGIDFASLLKRKETEEEEKIHDHSHDLHSKSRSNEHLYEHQNGHHQHGVLHKRIRVDSSTSHHSVVDKGSMMSLASIGTEFEAENVQLPEEEERRQGTVTAKIYWDYFKAGAGVIKSILLIALCLAAQGAYIASDWWLSHWSNEEENRYAAIRQDAFIRAAEGVNVSSNFTTNVTIPYVDTHYNVGIFSAIIGSVFLFGLLRALMFFKVTVDASQELHNKMFASILRSHIGFFDNNPVGRILNRFTKDIGQMDDILPICFFDFVQCSLLIVGIVIVAGVVNPWVFIPVVPLIILFVIIRRYYLRTSRHIKRLEGTTRSPVYSHLSASLQGLHTIRAFRVEEKFVDEFDAHQDLHTESWFLFLTTSRWLAIRLDWLCALFITSVSFSCVLAAGTLNAGLVGLSMSYAMTLMGMFQWGVRQSAEVENQMISVERVLDYAKLPSEAPLEVEEKKQPPPDWPQNGKIHAEGACLKYSADLPLVLKDLNFTIRAKEKVGIVGRTGAGKSSLITMLFRLVEPTGVLMIDDINIQNIGLHDLRKHISIIPQDPVLFTGALRRNLDPFHNHSDEALWRALEEVQLKPAIEDLPHGLDSEVSEGGVNFSVGQRQLICLARAILRNNRILMIDEATANVDPRTDALIQQTIREKFKQCTVLTIAHRLHTIMDSDRIMVLDEGRILEFEAPYLLLQKPASLLRKLVDQTGKSETIHLMEIAEAAYNKTDLEGESIQHMSASHHDISIVIDEREEKDINTNAEDNDFTTDTRNDFEENDAKAEVDKDSEKIEGHKGSENILEQKNSSIDKQEYSSPDIGDSIDETSEELGKDIAVENIDNADASLDTDKKSKSYESSSSSSSSESESENDNTDIKTRLISKDGQFDKENDHNESNENEAGDNDDAESAPGAVEDKEDNERREEEQESKDSDSLLKKK